MANQNRVDWNLTRESEAIGKTNKQKEETCSLTDSWRPPGTSWLNSSTEIVFQPYLCLHMMQYDLWENRPKKRHFKDSKTASLVAGKPNTAGKKRSEESIKNNIGTNETAYTANVISTSHREHFTKKSMSSCWCHEVWIKWWLCRCVHVWIQ